MYNCDIVTKKLFDRYNTKQKICAGNERSSSRGAAQTNAIASYKISLARSAREILYDWSW